MRNTAAAAAADKVKWQFLLFSAITAWSGCKRDNTKRLMATVAAEDKLIDRLCWLLEVVAGADRRRIE